MTVLIAIISALSFYIFPMSLGFIISKVLLKNIKPSLVDQFVYGSLAFFCFNFLVYTINPNFYSNQYSTFLKIFSGLTLLLFLTQLKTTFKYLTTQLPLLLLIFLVSGIVYGIWHLGIAYPLTMNWDFFHHQTLANNIMSGRLSFFTSKISDTFVFNGYSPLFHLLLAWPQWVFNSPPLDYFWWLEFAHLFTTLLVSYYLCYKITHSQLSSLIAILLSGFIFESFIIYGSLQLIPQTLVSVIFAYFVATIITLAQPINFRLIPYFIFFLLLHYVIGAVCIAALILLVIIKTVPFFRQSQNLNLAVFALSTILLLTPYFKLPLSLVQINQGEALSFAFTTEQKLGYFRLFSGFILFSFLTFGVIKTFIHHHPLPKYLLIISLFLLAIVFSPIPYALKFYTPARYLVDVLAAIGFSWLLSYHKSGFINKLILTIFTSILIIIFISSGNSIKNILIDPLSSGQLSFNELKAAQFLHNRYANQNVFLISDPSTQQILEPLSGINTQGGCYASLDTRNLLINIGQKGSPDLIKSLLWQVKDQVTTQTPDKLIYALSGRYFRWFNLEEFKKRSISYNIWNPSRLTLNNIRYSQQFTPDYGFTLIYSNPDIILFEVNR